MKIDLEGLSKRIPGTGNFISIDATKCNNCDRCLVICIMSLWRRKEGKIYLMDDYQSKCLECAACFQVCDAGAIQFTYPAGGTGIVIEKG
ncbi:MAG: 4Fe-4S dicluster domain-containing protein [Candidatus Hermodarchaeota archaeon]